MAPARLHLSGGLLHSSSQECLQPEAPYQLPSSLVKAGTLGPGAAALQLPGAVHPGSMPGRMGAAAPR